ncbi:MAG: hypothetical protein AVDCRST_MAG38-878 [uncultured Solirubrobacteraceae bacterium]|uniref:DUF2382 domain-containing protein n=1 Tax=uncultured Solirubrobacteraceae bacterium TaxID=1162706 RepID=A0A6J4R9A3_9ACTN|nr:MAG: hypothetical protein AVDCRST_MAG38-878 [uncultured Solirubrobacteraceae bacterium]
MSIGDITAFRGRDAIDSNGEKIGSIDEIYEDTETGKPEWLAVKTGLFGSGLSFIPLAEASESADGLRVPYTKAQVKDAPNADADNGLSQEEERRLYSHYGLPYSEMSSDSGLPQGGTGTAGTTGTTGTTTGTTGTADVSTGRGTGDPTPGGTAGVVGNDVSGPETDQAMTRSEEELSVGTQQVESGRVRLRKHVVSENVTTSVPVEREQVRVEREPITDANVGNAMSGPALSEEEHEVVLHEETAVVDKDVVPKERVRLDKDVTTEQQQVSEEVRKEQIEVDGDPDRR